MPKKKKTWKEKMQTAKASRIVDIQGKMLEKFGPGKMLIPSPFEIQELIFKIPAGKVATVEQIRTYLAQKHAVKVTCPLTTGIFLNIVAHAAEEEAAQGAQQIAPYWRVVSSKGELNPKFPGGIDAQAEKLKQEGVQVEFRKRGKPRIADLQRYLVKW